MKSSLLSGFAGTLAVLTLFCLPAVTQAQSSEITVYVGGFLGDSFIAEPPVLFGDPTETTVFNDKVTVGARYAYFFTSHFALEGGIGFTPASIASSLRVNGGSNFNSIVAVDTFVYQANALVHLFRGPVIPYVTGGVGAVDFHFRRNQFDFVIPSETDFAWNAGGGIKVPVSPTTAIRGDARV